MEIAELKSFLEYAGFFLLSLLEKKSYSDFQFSKTTRVASTPPPTYLFGAPISRTPDTRFWSGFLHKDGLE